ncbi:hypothetical protein E4U42_004663 [Claviceps africana]|uniref:Uncharacterized protein n=1 Tax=Claviceps africana TaxID=83212 RepID=A0A8K0NHX7_9HYPO|nr:hypothetical protein E4U42_004663 [Claviceps africana]
MAILVFFPSLLGSLTAMTLVLAGVVLGSADATITITITLAEDAGIIPYINIIFGIYITVVTLLYLYLMYRDGRMHERELKVKEEELAFKIAEAKLK